VVAADGRSTAALNRRITQRETRVTRWPSERLHIWNLVATCLGRMSYGAMLAGSKTDGLFATTPQDESAA